MTAVAGVRGKVDRLRKLLADPVTSLKTRRSPRLMTALWNAEYRIGRWNYLDAPQNSEVIVDLVQRFAPNGRILDLGCGTAANVRLAPGTYLRYHGVDISDAAIAKARAAGRPNHSFEVADIAEYVPGDTYDCVLMREVLYYLREDVIPSVLARAVHSLAGSGVVIVQVWNVAKYAHVVEALRRAPARIVEEIEDGASGRTFVLDPVAEVG